MIQLGFIDHQRGAEGDVVADRSLEELIVLHHGADHAAPWSQAQLRQWHPADADFAGITVAAQIPKAAAYLASRDLLKQLGLESSEDPYLVVYSVLKHPEVKARVLKEVDELFAAGEVDEDGLLKKLPVLNGAIMESMRLFPPIWIIERRVIAEDEVGGRFWIFRQGLFGGDEVPKWWIHGLFG